MDSCEALAAANSLTRLEAGVDMARHEAYRRMIARGIVADPYTTELAVAVLGAKYRWARAAGLL